MRKTYDNNMYLSVDYCTHAVDAVDEGVVAGVAHGQPVEQEEEDVDILKPEYEAYLET
jgi:hypothetical protein